ncbi:type VI secretion system baseplate subunit TssK [Pseudoduganella umbonata]|uniref:Type VI secretion system baseplate subunit TssK n=1 Tax=Pseudoduganella umbonata TaxID=864828 RepID=A0A4P8HPG9_9BURK|nr:type VI secretion system baseplate subunit TssK [Pseudoduganella umbonata]MBB3221227.1 type VI secretion system protein ImpJ [Pseudoduganella umbonata]QCP10412.1 type VI secretion system baseplate subunit TssK [Pseudoduganella umbonata]
MSWNSKVIWSEGMLLQPQHMQQHDRYLDARLEGRAGALRPYPWGVAHLELDTAQLGLGKVALRACSGVLPDGTPFGLAGDEDIPAPLDIPPDARDVLVVLALPLRRHGVPEVDDGNGVDNAARHRRAEADVWDSNGLDFSTRVEIGKLRLRLALQEGLPDGCMALGIVRVLERRADNQVVLDTAYCAPVLALRAAPPLAGFVDELQGLLHQRAEALAARLAQPQASGAGEIADFLLLQLLNRSQPRVAHLARTPALHPHDLYRELCGLAGELATFTRADKRTPAYPPYRHDALAVSFAPLMLDLRRSLSAVMDPAAVALALEERQFGIRVAVLPDRALLQSATFVLAVHAQLPPDAVRSGFPPQVKIGSVETIRDLVNLQLPGIPLRPLSVAPRQLPYLAGHTYFELDRASDYWQQLNSSAGFAMHVAGHFPGLRMQFWAIRNHAS